MTAPLLLPGLIADTSYRVVVEPLPGGARTLTRGDPAWMADGVVASGRQLGVRGVQPPGLEPETAILIRVVAV